MQCTILALAVAGTLMLAGCGGGSKIEYSTIHLPTGHSLTEGIIPAGGSRTIVAPEAAPLGEHHDATTMTATLTCPAGGADCNVIAVMGDVAETTGSALGIEWKDNIRSQVSRGLLDRYYDGVRTLDTIAGVKTNWGRVEAMSQPTINVFFAESDRDNTAGRNAVMVAVRELNRVLPSGRSIRVAGDLSGTPSIYDGEWDRGYFLFYYGPLWDRGTILVYFAPPERIEEIRDRESYAFALSREGLERSIVVLPDTIDPELAGPTGYYAQTVVHELLHAIGFSGHLNAEAWEPPSHLNYSYTAPSENLPQLDAAAIHFLYLDGEDGLGPWRDTGRYSLTGMSGDGVVNFRATYDNGVITAGWEGVGSLGRLGDWHGTSGTATWTGEMVGFHAARGVDGDVGLTVDLSRVYNGSHNLSFDDIRYQDDMALWDGTGELDYRVSIDNGEAFTDANSEISGRFLGSEYQAMGGTVDRYNLVGAFGGSKEE